MNSISQDIAEKPSHPVASWRIDLANDGIPAWAGILFELSVIGSPRYVVSETTNLGAPQTPAIHRANKAVWLAVRNLAAKPRAAERKAAVERLREIWANAAK